MQTHSRVEDLRKTLDDERIAGRTIGFVPTMGALHDGHVSLLRRAKTECEVVVLSIFVNPLQFGANEDLSRYPRPIEQDLQVAEEAGVAHVFIPSADEMYPTQPVLTKVVVSQLTDVLEGALRPGHFDGVSTVVAKLLAITGRCRAYFGEKDWQQLLVVKQLVADLSLPVEVVPCPIIREADGLAMSSRNAYLDADHRKAARALSRALAAGTQLIGSGERNSDVVSAAMMDVMAARELVEPQYAVVAGPDLRSPEIIDGDVRLLVAARVGSARLIDNVGVAV